MDRDVATLEGEALIAHGSWQAIAAALLIAAAVCKVTHPP
jgi:hypothetical protein